MPSVRCEVVEHTEYKKHVRINGKTGQVADSIREHFALTHLEVRDEARPPAPLRKQGRRTLQKVGWYRTPCICAVEATEPNYSVVHAVCDLQVLDIYTFRSFIPFLLGNDSLTHIANIRRLWRIF